LARVLIDTGVWYSRYDPRDTAASQEDVEAVFELVQPFDIILPWPIAYETLRTRFTRNRIGMSLFEEELKSPKVQFIDDAQYRDDAIELSFESSRAGRPLSMVDCVLRL
jgi:predicted nucleic acid-binding protein